MGEAQEWLFEPSFNRAVKVCASDDRITSDAGVVLLREADHRLGLAEWHRLGLAEWLAGRLGDPRRQDLIRYQLVELLRASVYAQTQGYAAHEYSAQDEADHLAHGPAMKMTVWDRPGEQTLAVRLASQPSQSRLIDILTLTPGNRAALRDALGESCERHLRVTGGDHAARRVTVAIDSFPILVHGRQPGAAYNGHYRETIYHPLVASYSVAGRYDSMSRRCWRPRGAVAIVAAGIPPGVDVRIEYEATTGCGCDLGCFPRPRGPRTREWLPPQRHAFPYEVRRCWRRLPIATPFPTQLDHGHTGVWGIPRRLRAQAPRRTVLIHTPQGNAVKHF